jgi:Raf kinase inhibitor-like YbhB/YbcL family protein
MQFAVIVALTLSSRAFAPNAPIPAAYTCDGAGIAPPLTWTGAPEGTRSFALIVDDPDAPDPKAPQTTFVHWVVWDLPSTASGLPENGALPAGAKVGLNDRKQRGYTGPCPPIGRHRYFFKLYAVDRMLGDLGDATKDGLEQAMHGHVRAHVELIGTYERPASAR